MATDIGTGTSITFSSSFFAEVLDITMPELSRKAVPTSHMTTSTWHTHMPGDLVEGGELRVEMHYDFETAPPITGTEETVTITIPSGATWSFTGFMITFGATVPLEDVMKATATIKVDGQITFTPAPSS